MALPDSGLFSGKITQPSNEADYDTWRSNVDLFLTDPPVSDLNRSCKILESLLPPAADIVKHLGPQALPSAYLELLDSAYDTVADGEECFASFSVLCKILVKSLLSICIVSKLF